jgi:gluconokinase
MGVSGSGKTTIATLLAEQLDYTFADGDDFHPVHNVAKMARAEPLTDADREPWLETLAAWIGEQHAAGRSTVLACSALKRRYRDILRAGAPTTAFVHLAVPKEALLERMQRRRGHFMPTALLDSQLKALEPLHADEPGIAVNAAGAPETVVAAVLSRLGCGPAPPTTRP